MRYFGQPWGAPVCQYIDKCATPVWDKCVECGRTFTEADTGLELPFLKADGTNGVVYYHLDCFLKNIGVNQ